MYARTRSPDGRNDRLAGDRPPHSKIGEGAGGAEETLANETKSVARTARHEAGNVVGEARGQVRRLASEAREKAGVRVRDQHGRMVEQLRAYADELGDMAGDGASPVRAAAGDLAARGRQVADYLADRGPEGLLSEVQSFARRRPLAFLAGALAAGFLAGRLGKNIYKAQADSDTGTDPGGNGSRRYGRQTYGSQGFGTGYPSVPAAEPVTAPATTGSAWETTPPAATSEQWTEPVAGDPTIAMPVTPSQTTALYAAQSHAEPDPLSGDERYGTGGRQ